MSLHLTALREFRRNDQLFRYLWVSRCTRFDLAYILQLVMFNPRRLDIPIQIAMVAMVDEG